MKGPNTSALPHWRPSFQHSKALEHSSAISTHSERQLWTTRQPQSWPRDQGQADRQTDRILNWIQSSEHEHSLCIHFFPRFWPLHINSGHFQLRNERRIFQRKMFSMKYLNMVKTISKVELNVLCDNGLSNLSSLQVVKKGPQWPSPASVAQPPRGLAGWISFVLTPKTGHPRWGAEFFQFLYGDGWQLSNTHWSKDLGEEGALVGMFVFIEGSITCWRLCYHFGVRKPWLSVVEALVRGCGWKERPESVFQRLSSASVFSGVKFLLILQWLGCYVNRAGFVRIGL